MSKKILAFVLALVLVCSLVPAVAAAETSATISFVDKANRTSYSTASQVWQQNGITVTNNKDASTSNVGDYADPARFYKSSTVIIEYPGMTKIVIDCTGSYAEAKHVAAWTDTLTAQGVAHTVEEKVITITLDAAVDSLTVAPLAAQARAYSITVYADESGSSTPEETLPEETTAPSEPEETTAPSEPEVTEPADTTLTIAEAIAMGQAMAHNTYTDVKYTVTGVITEVYNTQYGNMRLTDEAGNILTIYGTYSADGSTRYDAMEVKPVAGDTVTVLGIVGQYNGTAQIKNGWIIEHVPGTAEPTEPSTPVEPEGDTLTIAEAIALGGSMSHNTYTEKKYNVTGVITEVYNTQYGNMKLTDEAGNILTIYGTYDATGDIRYDAMDVKPVAGDTVTVYGIVGQYNGTPQIKNGWIVEHIPAGTEPTEPTDPEVTDPTDPSTPVEDGTVITIAEALALGAAQEQNTYTTEKYKVTGVITEVENATYGNMYITDGTDTLYIYGTYNADGSARYDAMEVKPDAGDTVTIYGIVGNYNGNPQIKNGWIVEYTEGEPPATEPLDPNSVVYDMTILGVDGEEAGPCSRDLDENVTMTISNGLFAAQTRIYKNADAVISSKVAMNYIVLNMAANKAGDFTFPVSVSADGETWEVLNAEIAYTGAYTDITIELPEGCQYVKLETPNAQIRIKEMTINFAAAEQESAGDMDGDGQVTNDDVIALMWNVLFPDENPVQGNADLDGDGAVTNDDVIKLMWHILFPEENPL